MTIENGDELTKIHSSEQSRSEFEPSVGVIRKYIELVRQGLNAGRTPDTTDGKHILMMKELIPTMEVVLGAVKNFDKDRRDVYLEKYFNDAKYFFNRLSGDNQFTPEEVGIVFNKFFLALSGDNNSNIKRLEQLLEKSEKIKPTKPSSSTPTERAVQTEAENQSEGGIKFRQLEQILHDLEKILTDPNHAKRVDMAFKAVRDFERLLSGAESGVTMAQVLSQTLTLVKLRIIPLLQLLTELRITDERDKLARECGVEVIRPPVGDRYNRNEHDAVKYLSPDTSRAIWIAEVRREGLRFAGEIISRAEVCVEEKSLT